MSNATPEELAATAREPGTFSFIERLRGRNYAKDDVAIYLNEELGYKLAELKAQIKDTPTLSAEELAAIQEKIDAILVELAPDKYIFHIEGISNEDYDKLVDEAAEQVPYEYEETVDPWTGKKTQEPINSDKRNEYFTNALWAKVIRKVEYADGSFDESINSEFVEMFRRLGPLNALQHVGLTIEKVRMGSEWIEYAEDEDFLVKP
jgi:hypothetical protein